MKVLGNAKEDGNGSGGIIVHLNYAEASILKQLQDVVDGKEWSMRLNRDIPEDKNIDKSLLSVYQFVLVNYSINGLKEIINRLNVIVNGEFDEH